MNPPATNMRLDGLLKGYADAPPLPVSGISLDSRAVRAGDTFFALRGNQQHGLKYLPQVEAAGASAVVWEKAEDISVPHASVPAVGVDQLSAHLGEIAARFYGQPSEDLFVAGVTGTDGKTSTAHLIAQWLQLCGVSCAYFGTLGVGSVGALQATQHTTSDAITVQKSLAEVVRRGVSACAMEVSSHALDQHRVGGVRFDAVVLTNVGRDHLDYHGSQAAYAAAKRRLFEAADQRAMIINRDDAQGARWIAEGPATADHLSSLLVYGLDGDRPAAGRYLLGRGLHLDADGLRLHIDSSWGAAALRAGLLGRFNAYNLLAALAVVLNNGVSLQDALAVSAQLRTVPGRAEAFRAKDGGPLVVVDYAHTPQALQQILQAMKAHAAGRLICVFGCGGERDAGKRPLMARSAADGADVVIVTDDNPRREDPAKIVEQIVAGFTHQDRYQIEHDRKAAIAQAIDQAHAGDVVVIAGKGHETTQDIGGHKHRFSDRALVAARLGLELAS